MKALSKYLAGTVGAVALTVTAASPAQAQIFGRDHDRGGIDAGDIITGVALVGGIAALIAALDGNDNRYGRYGGRYDSRYDYGRYGNGSYGGYGNYGNYGSSYRYGSAQAAVNVCAREAQRIGRNVQITDLDRTNRGYRVRGRIDVVDYDGRGWNRSYDVDRDDFSCYAANGRIYDFRV